MSVYYAIFFTLDQRAGVAFMTSSKKKIIELVEEKYKGMEIAIQWTKKDYKGRTQKEYDEGYVSPDAYLTNKGLKNDIVLLRSYILNYHVDRKLTKTERKQMDKTRKKLIHDYNNSGDNDTEGDCPTILIAKAPKDLPISFVEGCIRMD